MGQSSKTARRAGSGLQACIKAYHPQCSQTVYREPREDEEESALDVADSSHAFQFLYPILRGWSYDLNIR